ncbi:hypothetical protein SAMN05660297_03022 [Natronincola peptidivorans]|uniref:Uncharacterized protein n=1 Tax=Natronincola peptidivorans TaxID=426128 RepID=A0A1I0G393_9FIRM|nr:hypothetical protein [Natronincola peptidivorans]SET64341.1 hypothetical protein SAMN05660297_03022 [Natronincola peptidivorans]
MELVAITYLMLVFAIILLTVGFSKESKFLKVIAIIAGGFFTCMGLWSLSLYFLL